MVFLIKKTKFFVFNVEYTEEFDVEEQQTGKSMELKNEVECVGSLGLEASLALAVLIAVVCVVGNSTVLFIYTRSKIIAESKIFELAFAVLDISAVLLMACYQ